MAIEQPQHGEAAPDQAQPPAPAFAGAARRRFTKKAGALVTAGAVVTLKSQAGMASTIKKSPSGMLSGGINSHAPAPTCNGQKPSWWADKCPSSWGGYDKSSMFRSPFTCTKKHPCYGKTLYSVCAGDRNADPNGVAQYCVAAYLNAKAGYTSFLTANQVQTMWNDYTRYGYYSPRAGTQWGAAEICNYLSGTMD